MKPTWLAIVALSFAPTHAPAQDPQDAASAMPAAPEQTASSEPLITPDTALPADVVTSADCCLLPNGTPIEIEIIEPLSSKLHKRGDRFALRLAISVLVDGHVVLPAGTPGTGEIIHAAKSGGGGKPGELLLTARYLEVDGKQILLRGFKLGGSGKDNTGVALAASSGAMTAATIAGASVGAVAGVGIVPALIRGAQAEIPAGTRATAKFAANVQLPPHDTTSTNTTTKDSIE